jgi:UDP-N-acetylmuramoylalanine--D-glutamate ligase
VPAAQFVGGPFTAALVEGSNSCCAVRVSLARRRAVEAAAREQGIPVPGRAGLFAKPPRTGRLRESEGYHPAVLAVTGTNGKTTVTSLTGQLVERAARPWPWPATSARRCSTRWPQHIDAGALPQVWVLELSSFQLEGVHRLRADRRHRAEPHAGPPGLARQHAAYAAAKARIFGRPGLMVLNRDDPAS